MLLWPLSWEDPLEEGMATHSSILAWRVLWTEESGGLQSVGLQRVGHNWSDLARMHTHSLVAQMVKSLSSMQETWLRSLSQEDPLEKGMATHSSILSWRIPWTEKPGRLEPIGLQRVGHNWSDLAYTHSTEVNSSRIIPAFWGKCTRILKNLKP